MADTVDPSKVEERDRELARWFVCSCGAPDDPAAEYVHAPSCEASEDGAELDAAARFAARIRSETEARVRRGAQGPSLEQAEAAEVVGDQAMTLDIKEGRRLVAGLRCVSLCESWMQWGIRHLVRNCEIGCDHGEDGCNDTPDRGDGAAIARLLGMLPALLSATEERDRLREALEALLDASLEEALYHEAHGHAEAARTCRSTAATVQAILTGGDHD